ncbi:MAG: hypothetical protein U1E10_07750 [Bdellovibrionales bacterium]|nr:hypothetical protein [Bdellovibrionales bacterium]
MTKILVLSAMLAVPVSFQSIAEARPVDLRQGAAVVNLSITEAEVRAAQEAWGKALIQISTEHDNKGVKKATETAKAIIDAAYGYQYGSVLFKPTLTSGEQTFRTTKEGALAYFVGGNKGFPNDSGFALKGWRGFKTENASIFINGDLAISMGKVHLTDKNGQVTTVDKTWAFKKDATGALKIVLHHSSLPFQPTSGSQASAH